MVEAADYSDDLEEHLWKRRDGLIYKIRLSILYHLKRERFLDLTDKLMSIIVAVFATAAVGALLKKAEDLEIWISAATAVFALIPVVFNPAESARKNAQLASNLQRLLVDCEVAGEHWPVGTCDSLSGRFVEITAGESSPLSALVAECQNQLAIAKGDSSKIIRLFWYQRLLKNVWDFDATKLDQQ